MTQEEKQLLFKNLCGRIPYGVKVGFNKKGDVFTPIKFDLQTKELFAEDKSNNCICIFKYDIFKPYLRPMSSMTEEEKYTYKHMLGATLNSEGVSIMFVYVEDFSIVVDWLYSYHFDFRGLIEEGLALEAPEDMYK